MTDVSRASRQKSWRPGLERVSLLAAMAIRQRQVAEKLAELRERHELTQEQAAAKVGVTVRQWQRWESGSSMPHPRNLGRVAQTFEMPVDDFFDEGEVGQNGGAQTQLDRIEAKVDAIAELLTAREGPDPDLPLEPPSPPSPEPSAPDEDEPSSAAEGQTRPGA